MGDTLDFPAFPGQPELDGMDEYFRSLHWQNHDGAGR